MTPDEIKEARQKLGLTLEEMATMLGYGGVHRRSIMFRMEQGSRDLPPCHARLLAAYLDGYRPPDWPE